MSKVKRPRGLAKAEAELVLEELRKHGTVTIREIAQLDVRSQYVHKYIFYLRNTLGYQIKANRIGRFVVSYTLTEDGSSAIKQSS